MENSLREIIENDLELKKTSSYDDKNVYKVNIDLEIDYKNINILYLLLAKFCELNNENIVCVLNIQNQNDVIEKFIKKIKNYINKIKFIITIQNTDIKNTIKKIKFDKINKVKGYLTPFLLKDQLDAKYIFSHTVPNFEFHKFLNRIFKKIEELDELFKIFDNNNLVFDEFIKFIIPDKNYLYVLDKEGYNYYNNGWSFTRVYQHLKLLLHLGIKSKSFENKKILEIGPGLQDFVKIAKFCKSKEIRVIDKNIIFVMLSRYITTLENIFHIDLIKESDNLDQVPNCDLFFSKGFLNISSFEKDKIEKLIKNVTQKINQNGEGYWFTYNTDAPDFNNRILHLKNIFFLNNWVEFSLSEKERKSFGLHYLPNVKPLNFKLLKKN